MKKRVLALLLVLFGVNMASAVVIEDEAAIQNAIIPMPPLTSFPLAVKSDESLYTDSELYEMFGDRGYLSDDSGIYNLKMRQPNWTKLFRELGGKSDATLIYSTDGGVNGQYWLAGVCVNDLETYYLGLNDPQYQRDEYGDLYLDDYGAQITYPSALSIFVFVSNGSEFYEGRVIFEKEGTTYTDPVLCFALHHGQRYSGADHEHSVFHAIAFFSDETFLIQRCIHQYTDVVDIKRRFIVDTSLCKMTEEGIVVLKVMRHYEE